MLCRFLAFRGLHGFSSCFFEFGRGGWSAGSGAVLNEVSLPGCNAACAACAADAEPIQQLQQDRFAGNRLTDGVGCQKEVQPPKPPMLWGPLTHSCCGAC